MAKGTWQTGWDNEEDTPQETGDRSALPRVDWPRTVLTAALFALLFLGTHVAGIPPAYLGEISGLVIGLVGLGYWLGKTSRASGYLGSVLFGGLVVAPVFLVLDLGLVMTVFSTLLAALMAGGGGWLGFWRKRKVNATPEEIRWGRIVSRSIIGGIVGFVYAVAAVSSVSDAGLAILFFAPILTMAGIGLGGLLGLLGFSVRARRRDS